MTTKLIIYDGARFAFHWLALEAWDETEPSNDARRREATRALGGWMRPVPQEDSLASYRPESLEIPADAAPDTLRAVAGLLRLEGDLELDRSERCHREEDEKEARLAMAGWWGSSQLAAALDALARKEPKP